MFDQMCSLSKRLTPIGCQLYIHDVLLKHRIQHTTLWYLRVTFVFPADFDSQLRVAFAGSAGDVRWLHDVYTMATRERHKGSFPVETYSRNWIWPQSIFIIGQYMIQNIKTCFMQTKIKMTHTLIFDPDSLLIPWTVLSCVNSFQIDCTEFGGFIPPTTDSLCALSSLCWLIPATCIIMENLKKRQASNNFKIVQYHILMFEFQI